MFCREWLCWGAPSNMYYINTMNITKSIHSDQVFDWNQSPCPECSQRKKKNAVCEFIKIVKGRKLSKTTWLKIFILPDNNKITNITNKKALKIVFRWFFLLFLSLSLRPNIRCRSITIDKMRHSYWSMSPAHISLCDAASSVHIIFIISHALFWFGHFSLYLPLSVFVHVNCRGVFRVHLYASNVPSAWTTMAKPYFIVYHNRKSTNYSAVCICVCPYMHRHYSYSLFHSSIRLRLFGSKIAVTALFKTNFW